MTESVVCLQDRGKREEISIEGQVKSGMRKVGKADEFGIGHSYYYFVTQSALGFGTCDWADWPLLVREHSKSDRDG